MMVATLLFSALQRPEPTGAAAIKEALLFGFEMAPPDRTMNLPPAAQRALTVYRSRARMFKPTTARVDSSPETQASLQFKRVGLERAVFSLFDRPDAAQLAGDYATRAALAYEWEGLPEVPLFEAAYADSFLAEHPTSPIAPFVQLFAGHRKLCAGNLIKELTSDNAAARRTLRESEAQLAAARDSGHPLIRVVAEHLLETQRCLER